MENTEAMEIQEEQVNKYIGSTSIVGILHDHLLGKNKYDPNRDVCKFYPSSAGRCCRSITYQMLGYKPKADKDPRILMIMENGTYMHNRIEHMLDETGLMIAPELSFKKEEWRISGRSDAVVKNFLPHTPSETIITIQEPEYKKDENGRSIKDEGGNRIIEKYKHLYTGPDNGVIIVELKSISSKGFKYAPKKDHLLQLHLYMYLLGIRMGMLLYENKDTQEMKEIFVPYDEELAKEVVSQVMKVNLYVDKYKLPEEEFQAKYSYFMVDGQLPEFLQGDLPAREGQETDFQCLYCDYKHHCYPERNTYDVAYIANPQ